MFKVEVDGNNVYTKDRLKYGFERVVLTLKGWKILQLLFPPFWSLAVNIDY